MKESVEQVALSTEVDQLQKSIFSQKMEMTSLRTEREKIELLKKAFPLHYAALSRTAGEGPVIFCFRLAFIDWVDFVSRHIKSDDIAIKDPEIDQFREILSEVFTLCGDHRATAYRLAKSDLMKAEVEEKFGFGQLIAAVEALGDPQCAEYLEGLRAQGPIYPKIEELIDECYEVSQPEA